MDEPELPPMDELEHQLRPWPEEHWWEGMTNEEHLEAMRAAAHRFAVFGTNRETE